MCADIVDTSKKIQGYTVREITLRQMRALQAKEVEPEEFTYHIACLSVIKPDGKAITMDELNDLPVRLATEILTAVAALNVGSKTGNA